MAVSDAASLVAAAVRAACEARAPRRTVAAVAAAAVSAAAGTAAPSQQRRPRVIESAPADRNVGGEEEEARREAIKAKRRRRRQRKKEARAAAALDKGDGVPTNTAQAEAGDMETERTADTATFGAGDAQTAAGEVMPPRRGKAPDVFEKGHTGLTPPCKRHCGVPTEETGAEPEDASVDSDGSESGITIYTESEGGSAHPLWSPSMKIGRSEALRRWEEHKQMKRGEVPKLPAGGSGPSS